MLTVRTVGRWLDEAYPPGLAEDWDVVGLGVGDPDAAVTHVLLAVDVTDAVVAEARELGAELIVSHHPLLLRGIHSVTTDAPKGRVVAALLRAGIAVFTAHTNADSAAPGVSDALAVLLGLVELRPLVPAPTPAAGTDATASGCGLGRVGVLPRPATASEVAARLGRALPVTAGGVRLGGDPERPVSTVAVLGGAGDSLLDAARAAVVDLYVTSDLRHHTAQDFLAHVGAPALLDVSHWAAEWTWLPRAEEYLNRRAAEASVELRTTVSRIVTDPWTKRFSG